MTDRGTFIVNGIERAVVNQLVRSSGVFLSLQHTGHDHRKNIVFFRESDRYMVHGLNLQRLDTAHLLLKLTDAANSSQPLSSEHLAFQITKQSKKNSKK